MRRIVRLSMRLQSYLEEDVVPDRDALRLFVDKARDVEERGERMEKALEPFAKLAELYQGHEALLEGQFTYARAIDCQRARDVLEEVGG